MQRDSAIRLFYFSKNLVYLLLYFLHRVDKDKSGAITSDELQQALSNGKMFRSSFMNLLECRVVSHS